MNTAQTREAFLAQSRTQRMLQNAKDTKNRAMEQAIYLAMMGNSVITLQNHPIIKLLGDVDPQIAMELRVLLSSVDLIGSTLPEIFAGPDRESTIFQSIIENIHLDAAEFAAFEKEHPPNVKPS